MYVVKGRQVFGRLVAYTLDFRIAFERVRKSQKSSTGVSSFEGAAPSEDRALGAAVRATQYPRRAGR